MPKKQKFEIVVDNQLVEIDAEEFAIFGYGTFIVHRDYHYPTLWTVSEPRTGYAIRGRFITRKEAITQATKSAVKFTSEEVDAQIKRVLNDDLKTRYQKENYG